MLYANADDITRCIEIVRKELIKANINLSEEILEKITINVMNISDSKGGGYTSDIIQSFAETYVEHELYKKYL